MTGAPNDSFLLNTLKTLLGRHIIITTVRSSTRGNLRSLFDRNYEGFNIIFFENFKFFSDSFSITSFACESFNYLYMEKTCLVQESHPPSREKKKTLTPTGLRACSNCLPFAMRALYRYGSPLMRPALGHKTLVVIPRWSH